MLNTCMQLLEGLATIVVGFIAFFGQCTRYSITQRADIYDRSVMVDFPGTAKFLTPEERAFVIWKKSKLSARFWEGGI